MINVMKKSGSYSYKLLLLVPGICLLGACSYDTAIPNPEEYARIYMPQAADQSSKYQFVMTDSAQTIVYGAAYGGPDYPSDDISVTFNADPSLVDLYNNENGTTYEVLPEGSYELEKASAVIQKGELKTDPLRIRIKTAGFLEAFKEYLLPVTIGQTDGGASINEDLRTAYFVVEAQREGINLKVMSYGKRNVAFDMEEVAAVIRAHNPDLLVVREMDINTQRNGDIDQAAELGRLTGMNYFFAKALDFQGGYYGCAVFSRFPVIESAAYLLTVPSGEPGPLATITVKINESQELFFAGTHLSLNEEYRLGQAEMLLDVIGEQDIPVIVAGNINDQLEGATYTSLKQELMMICEEECPPNYPADGPVSYTDNILYSPGDRFHVSGIEVGTASTSSHLPVIANLLFFD